MNDKEPIEQDPEDPQEPSMRCEKCVTLMDLITIDEGDLHVFWCPNCGTICEYIDETKEFRQPTILEGLNI